MCTSLSTRCPCVALLLLPALVESFHFHLPARPQLRSHARNYAPALCVPVVNLEPSWAGLVRRPILLLLDMSGVNLKLAWRGALLVLTLTLVARITFGIRRRGAKSPVQAAEAEAASSTASWYDAGERLRVERFPSARPRGPASYLLEKGKVVVLERERTQAELRRLLKRRALMAEGAEVIRRRAAVAEGSKRARKRAVDEETLIVAVSMQQQSSSSVEAAAAAITTATEGAPRRIHVVVNPFGGGGIGKATLESVLPIFERAGVEVTVLETQYAGHAGELARTTPLLDAFVGIGGDGTAHEIANGLLRRAGAERVPMGMIPAGSGNTWAYDLGLENASAAAEAIVRGATTRVDVMAVQAAAPSDETPSDAPSGASTQRPSASVSEYAINICGFGMPAAVLEQANALRWLGSAQYELAGLVLIATGKTRYGARLEIEAEDGTVLTRELDECSFVQAQINMHMGKRVCFAPGASMTDGLLDLVIVSRSGGLDILHANARARGASHLKLPFVETIRCRSYVLTPHPTSGDGGSSIALNLDGELAGAAPFRVECLPGALEVFSGTLRTEPNDTSDQFEPQLVMSLVRALDPSAVD